MDRGSELYSQFLAGDDAVLEQLITEYKDGLILYLHTLVGDLTLAEELTEDTFVRLCVKKPKDKKTGSFKTWLYTIGRNVAISHLRKYTKTVPMETVAELADEQADLLNQYLQEEQKVLLHRGMEKLKAEYRQVLWLIYFEGLSGKEAAAVMGKSLHATEMLASRARQALKKELTGMEVSL